MRFTDKQQEAITCTSKNLQLIACAGSGKTEVVAQRIVHLLTLGPEKIKPENIVAFTFTDKAAGELKERIVTRVREKLGDVVGLAEMFVGTIHAFCLDLLKNEVSKFFKYEVLNEVQQSLFVDRNSAKSGLTITSLLDNPSRNLMRYVDTRNYISALSILRESELDLNNLATCSVYQTGLPKYKELLDDKNYFDYSSILSEAFCVLKDNNEVRTKLKKRVKFVVVDEYQDINPIQECIIRELSTFGAGICVVGDDDQTIYQWRGGDVNNILNFEKRYKNVTQIPLDKNFRSSIGIVETARQFIEANDVRLTKHMETAGAQTYEKGDIVALSFESPEEEAEYIAEAIRSLHGLELADERRGISWSDMAILLRSVRGDAAPITDALKKAGIPFIVKGMTDLFRTTEAEAARTFFWFMADAHNVNRDDVKRAWLDTDIGIKQADIETALDNAEETKSEIAKSKIWGDGTIQKVYLDFLETAGVREEKIPQKKRDVVLYNLGKFSEVIWDFEFVHYKSVPSEKYHLFGKFLEFAADNSYPEGWQESSYINPNAVQIMTIHQSKGMQWPVVFIPALLRNRFPAKRPGGRTVWHLLPKTGVKSQNRYEGTVEDERRLFYVALTRSQKFLHITYGPKRNNQLYQKPSEFWKFVLRSKYVSRRKSDYSHRNRLKAEPRMGIANVTFSFSDIKYFFECPYRFKLQILCGFNAPFEPALGYGKSLHDVVSEIHDHAIKGQILDESEAERLVETHMNTPFASPQLFDKLKKDAIRVTRKYLNDNKELLHQVELSEKDVEIHFEKGVVIRGRIDLVRRLDNDEVTIVDLKSSDQAQAEQTTEMQLHTYAMGYEMLTGRSADFVEIYELDEGKRNPRAVDVEFINDVKSVTQIAAGSLIEGKFDTKPEPAKCKRCDSRPLCSTGQTVRS